MASALLLVAACQEEPSEPQDFTLQIVGIHESMTAEFTELENGRVADVPVSYLSIVIKQGQNEVYRKEYVDEIPDPLPEITLKAAWYQVYVQSHDGLVDCYSADEHHPIFTGYADLQLTTDNQELPVEMNNLSARVLSKIKEGQVLDTAKYDFLVMRYYWDPEHQYCNLTGTIERDPMFNQVFSNDSAFTTRTETFVTAKTLLGTVFEFGDKNGRIVASLLIDFESPIDVEADDQITFTIDVDMLDELASSGRLQTALVPVTWEIVRP